ncbi:organic cation transporter protein-like isoform X4 [Stegodyphus dumicola]|uniref:organic cation transporter protein-like isoform X4 n=1 Tax=Stegodyphus dumicola TaxID=202533 RepID=UPI0015A91194|nr:organic cation transporter protein-like isoform X4 [Stegodyphus dumicola]
MDFWCVEPNSTDSSSLHVLLNSTDQILRRLNNDTSKDECMITVYSEQNVTMVSFVNISQPEIVPCTKWHYDTSYTSQTLVSEFDLVCDREWLVSLAKSIYMIGFLISVIFFGQLSDCDGNSWTSSSNRSRNCHPVRMDCGFHHFGTCRLSFQALVLVPSCNVSTSLTSNVRLQPGQDRSTVFDLFRSPKMRCRVLNMIYLWIVNAFMYYGLSYNTNDLAGNPYLNFFLAGALEIPAYASVFFGIKKWGRRPTLTFFMLVGGCACAAIIAVPESISWLSTAFAMIGKFCISGSFGILYLYTSELFPTVVRNVAIGTCSMWARVGSILAPFVKELGKATHPSVPNVIYAVLAVSSGLLALLLPETKGQKMPDSLLEGEHFGEHEP